MSLLPSSNRVSMLEAGAQDPRLFPSLQSKPGGLLLLQDEAAEAGIDSPLNNDLPDIGD
eukprot:CAMPEP_0115371546 /NCGR_PEP_ID=MMETSP0271-20121206/438_1 /TAXON_ID=71861 /ORGANISM="Scrippsiella trochoidea, Strain CCMP3099" /LENGTH=58 /DNA_ID=CAMNT_0002794453 /DNA_START=1240 /DNA_END=1417 /DNA_ORIENTATION=-